MPADKSQEIKKIVQISSPKKTVKAIKPAEKKAAVSEKNGTAEKKALAVESAPIKVATEKKVAPLKVASEKKASSVKAARVELAPEEKIEVSPVITPKVQTAEGWKRNFEKKKR